MKVLNWFFAVVFITTILYLIVTFITDKTGYNALFGSGYLACAFINLYNKYNK